jgi:hypothetical protein
MRVLIGLVVLVSLFFLFGGLAAVGITGDNLSDQGFVSLASKGKLMQQGSEKYSMKQIDSVTSRSNFAFTSSNASSTAYLP